MHLRSGVACLSLIMTVTAQCCHAKTSKPPVGLVVSITPHKGKIPSANVLLMTEGYAQPISEGDFVAEGDEIIVPGRDQTVILSQRGGNTTVCADRDGEADRCRSIVAKSSALSPLGRFYESVVRISQRMAASSSASTLSSRDVLDVAPFSLTVDRSEPQKIRVGDRSIWLCWNGGEGPFHVSLNIDGSVIVEASSDKREITLPRTTIIEGRALLMVRDSRDQALSVRIEGSRSLPLPPDFSEAAPTPEANRLLGAAWLSQQLNGSLRLEASQALTELAPTFHLADTLRRGLLVADP